MKLEVGDIIPAFTAHDGDGKHFDSANYIGKKQLVIYFYPMDDTPGCTAQACAFRDQYQDFTDLGAEVIGISQDGAASHQNFSKQHQLPFILLSDEDKKIQELFGLKPNFFGLLRGRSTYVADKNGIIRMIYNSMSASTHINKALESIKEQ